MVRHKNVFQKHKIQFILFRVKMTNNLCLQRINGIVEEPFKTNKKCVVLSIIANSTNSEVYVRVAIFRNTNLLFQLWNSIFCGKFQEVKCNLGNAIFARTGGFSLKFGSSVVRLRVYIHSKNLNYPGTQQRLFVCETLNYTPTISSESYTHMVNVEH